MTAVADRIAKLRRMAEHPTSNPHEAAIAREEMERLIAKHPRIVAPLPMTEAGQILDEIYRNAECWICKIKLNYGWAQDISSERCPRHLKIKTPGDAGYYEWARGLKLGDVLSAGWSRGGTLPQPITLTIARMTATQYIMSDGSRFRRTGRFPGYRVGEDGRSGRTYLVELP